MFLITTVFQNSRSKRNPDRPGKVYLRVSRQEPSPQDTPAKEERTISTKVEVHSREEIASVIDLIVPYVRMLYAIIERYDEKADKAFTLDDIVSDLRKAMSGDTSMNDVIRRSAYDFPFRADLVSLGNDIRRFFTFRYPTHDSTNNLIDYLVNKSRQSLNEANESAARSYSSVRCSLSRFTGTDNLPFADIDRDFIVRYSDWLVSKGVSQSTQSFYLRKLKIVLNQAADEGLITLRENLFKGLNTRIVFSRDKTVQSALSKDILKKIADADFSQDREIEVVRDMFMFGFYCRGMELIELMKLRKADVQNGTLRYRRRMVGVERFVRLDQSAQAIIKKYASSVGEYLFPFSERYPGLKTYSISDRVRVSLKAIGNAVNFPNLTFAMNRTSWEHFIAEMSAADILQTS